MTADSSRLKQLIAVARDGSSEKRRDLLRDITDVFMAAPDRYTPSELQHFDVIMSRSAEQVEMVLRREIAERLADAPSAPKGLIRQLAHDEITVAEPVLRRSEALNDDDLVGVIRQCGQAHMEAITKRREVTRKLASELVERGDEGVLICLAENRGAKFGAVSMEKMVGHARSVKALQKPLAERFDMPAPLLTKMYFFVSSALKKEILKRSDTLDPALIDEAVKTSRQNILDRAARDAQAEVSDARKFVAEKIAAGAVNENLLKELIDQRQGTAFVLAFSHLIGVDSSTAQSMLKDKSWEALAIACRASCLERATFAKIVFGLQREADQQSKALRILDLYQKIPQDAAGRVMRFWRAPAKAAASAAAGAAEQERTSQPSDIPRRARPNIPRRAAG